MNKNIRIENRIILIIALLVMIGIGTSSVYAYVETNVTVETPVPTTNMTVETPVPTPVPTPNMQSVVHKNHVGIDTANLNCDTCHGFPANLYPSEEVCDNCHTETVPTTPVPTVVATPVPTVVATPVPTYRIYSYDNIKVNHTIILCNPVSDDEHVITGLTEKNCGNPNLVLNNYPLGVMPSGGNSGKISASEMIMIKVRTNGHISLVPWETQPVKMNWYDANGVNSRLMYSTVGSADSFNNEVRSYIGHFSWEINKSGKYYVDVDEGDLGSARVVFDVIDNGQPIATVTTTPIVTYTQNPTVTATTIATAMPTVTTIATPTVTTTYMQTNQPEPGDGDNSGGCWNSYIGFGICIGDVATKTGAGILLGIGKGIADMLGW